MYEEELKYPSQIRDRVHTELTLEFNFVCTLARCNLVSIQVVYTVDRMFKENFLARIAQRSRAPAL